MLKNYLLTTLRNLRKNKGYTFINVAGLAIGLACSFFILIWVLDEVSYNRFHENGDQLYRVLRNATFGDQKYTWEAIPKPLAEALEANYPEIEHAVLLTWDARSVLIHEETSFRESGFHAGPAFFQIFSFPLLIGDRATVISEPDAIAISETLAAKFFGTDWRETALGQRISVNHRKDFTVRGVFRDVPSNSSLQFDYVLPAQDFFERTLWVDNWGSSGMRLFVQLRNGASGVEVSDKIAGVILEHHEDASATIFLQPVKAIRLHSSYRDHQLIGGRIEFVRIFIGVAIFLLLIASINFMNLATARSTQRAKEIGVRKVVGANRKSLVMQFMGESILIAAMATVMAVLLVELLMPLFNELTGKSAGLTRSNPHYLLAFAGIALITGLLSGSYPALFLSSFRPLNILRGTLATRPVTAALRKGLVVVQFTLSILLIIGTITVYTQLEYIRTKNLGVDRENVVSLALEGEVERQYESFQGELLRQPGIAGVTTSSGSPLTIGSSTTDPSWDGKSPEDNTLFHVLNVGHDFVETMGMTMKEGRSFSRDFGLDTANVIINERAAEAMGMASPLGQRIAFWSREGQVIGVVEDFHMSSLYEAIEPTILRLDQENTHTIYVRTQPGRTAQALASLEAVHRRFNPLHPFEYEFLDQQYEQQYQSEMLMGKLANLFAGVALFISCLGLFGLASFTTERRTKEIGIRKVLGASVSGIVGLLSRDFLKLVLIAFLIASPIAYYALDRWLSSFVYHIEIGIGTFLIGGAAAMIIALFTVSYQSIRAAISNPVKALRYE